LEFLKLIELLDSVVNKRWGSILGGDEDLADIQDLVEARDGEGEVLPGQSPSPSSRL